jgi:GT2 family glycosyltransferase/predicted Zn-dependent protease
MYDAIFAFAIFVFSILITSYFLRKPLSEDDGNWFYPARFWKQGIRPYKNYFNSDSYFSVQWFAARILNLFGARTPRAFYGFKIFWYGVTAVSTYYLTLLFWNDLFTAVTAGVFTAIIIAMPFTLFTLTYGEHFLLLPLNLTLIFSLLGIQNGEVYFIILAGLMAGWTFQTKISLLPFSLLVPAWFFFVPVDFITTASAYYGGFLFLYLLPLFLIRDHGQQERRRYLRIVFSYAILLMQIVLRKSGMPDMAAKLNAALRWLGVPEHGGQYLMAHHDNSLKAQWRKFKENMLPAIQNLYLVLLLAFLQIAKLPFEFDGPVLGLTLIFVLHIALQQLQKNYYAPHFNPAWIPLALLAAKSASELYLATAQNPGLQLALLVLLGLEGLRLLLVIAGEFRAERRAVFGHTGELFGALFRMGENIGNYIARHAGADDKLFVWGDNPAIYLHAGLPAIDPGFLFLYAYQKELPREAELMKLLNENPPEWLVFFHYKVNDGWNIQRLQQRIGLRYKLVQRYNLTDGNGNVLQAAGGGRYDFPIYRLESTVESEKPQPAAQKKAAAEVAPVVDGPLVSVIIATRNRPDTLKEAIQSVLNQSYQNIEIIVANDGGDDVSPLISELNERDTITYARHARTLGPAAPRNTGLKLARGKYCLFLDDDDIFYLEHVQTLVSFLEGSEFHVAYTDAYRAVKQTVDGEVVTVRKETLFSQDFSRELMLVRNYIPIHCVMFERAALEETGYFDENLSSHVDWDFWIRLALKYDFYHIAKHTCEYSFFTDRQSITGSRRADHLFTLQQIYKKYAAESARVPQIIAEQQKTQAGLQQEVDGIRFQNLQQVMQSDAQGDHASAMELMESLIEKDQWCAEYYNQLAVMQHQQGQLNAALPALEHAIRLKPGFTVAMENAVNLYLLAGNIPRVLELLERLAGLQPDNAAWPARTAEILLAEGNRETGILNLAAAANIDRENEKVRQLTKEYKITQKETDAALGKRDTVKKGFVSIVIPVFNKSDYTAKCLDALQRNTAEGNYEVLLVDNGSTDDTAELTARYCAGNPAIRYQHNQQNMGFAHACNQGAREAKGEYILFLNNDTEVTPGWLEPMTEVLKSDPGVAVVGNKLLFPDGSLQHAGVIIYENRKNSTALVAEHMYYQQPGDFAEAGQARTYQAVTAACMLVRKEVFNSVHGFDELYWNGYEDVDLCFKIGQQGHNIVYQPRSVVIHHESVSGPERFLKVSENTSRLLEKWQDKIRPDAILHEDGRVELLPHHQINAWGETEQVANGDMVSIIMLTYNALEYTKKCIDSLYANTRIPFELVLVDNNSGDGSREYLQQLAENKANIKLILNDENRGFAGGNNQGVEQASGKYVLLLNNDVLVAPGWLESLVAALQRDVHIGMVGPITNHISGRQKVAQVPYTDEKDFPQFAATVRSINAGKVTPRRRLAGFAVLLEKGLYQKVGGLDESFGSGNFEDDDLCLRIREAGYALMADESTFIHHFGSKSFEANQIAYDQSLEEKGQVFRAKWPNVDYEMLLELKAPLDTHHPELVKRASAALSRGEIEPALQMFNHVVSEDPLNNDAVLGLSIAQQMTGEADKALATIRRILNRDNSNPDAFNQAGLLLNEMGDPEAAKDMYIAAIQAKPDFVDAQRNYGMVLIEQEDFENGVQVLNKIIENHPEDVATLIFMAQLFMEAERPEEAQKYLEKAIAADPAHPLVQQLAGSANVESEAGSVEAYLQQAETLLANADYDQAKMLYDSVLKGEPENVIANYGRGLVALLTNDIDNAEAFFRRLTELSPEFAAGYLNLGNVAVQRGDFARAKEQFRIARRLDPENADATRLLAEICLQDGEYEEGVSLLAQLEQADPADTLTLMRLGELYQEAGRVEKAADYFQRVLKIDPDHPNAAAALAELG